MKTLYNTADDEIRKCISDFLELMKDTNELSSVNAQHLNSVRKKVILLAGLNCHNFNIDTEEAILEWDRRQALTFDIEAGVTAGVYTNIREAGEALLIHVKQNTDDFNSWKPSFIHSNPHTLPLLQHLAGIFSKAALKKQVGSVSDNSISKPASERLSKLLSERVIPSEVREGEILQRLESTLEGIVRDLIGRVMLESIVESALKEADVPYKTESEYSKLTGVVYDFRADFVIPNEHNPIAFIEVRKSSSRHASLYAKDKMFSAINWKGKHKNMLAIIVADGDWTAETLRTMANVFDYVVPLKGVNKLAETIKQYCEGDKRKLKWIIDFKISKN